MDSNLDFNMHQLMLVLTWLCLSTSENVTNPVHQKYFPSQPILAEVLSSISLTFAPGLYEVLQAATPPTTQFLRTLPKCDTKEFKKVWVVYVLVLKKSGFSPKIYIGSATNGRNGAYDRFYQYDRGEVMSLQTSIALTRGYRIVSRGYLCCAPMPSYAEMPKIRALFLALEATLSFVFWAMYSKGKTFNMAHMLRWPVETLNYRGLCTHSSLNETVAGNHDLTAEESEAMKITMEQRQKDVKHESYERIKAADPDGFRAKVNTMSKARYIKDSTKQKANSNKSALKKRQAAVKAKLWYCNTCEHSFTKESSLTDHLLGEKHAKRVAKAEELEVAAENNVAKKYICDSCGYSGDLKRAYVKHMNGPIHAAMMAGNNPYHCQVCDHTFKKPRDLKIHLSGVRHAERAARLEQSPS